MTEENKKEELDKWLEMQKRWLHEKISLGKIYDVIEMAFLEAINIGFEKGIKTQVNTTTISDCPIQADDPEAKIALLSKKVYDLQKENDRLKKDSEENQDLATIAYMQGATRKQDKLTEAKEIIREYLKATECWNYDFSDILKCNNKAEAFLKE